MPDVVLTGLPRSGSTLTCHILNRCPNTVALHEPIPMGDVARDHQGEALLEAVSRFFEQTRRTLLTERRATSKLVEGKVPDNTFGEAKDAKGVLRRSLASHGEVSFEGKDLSPDFLLAVKHNAGFTAMIEPLRERFPCYGIIRHPLAVLSSWNSVKLPVQQGHVHVGEQIDAGLRTALEQIDDRVERQFYILEWFFDRFTRFLPGTSILRYEDLVATGGRSLAAITPAAGELSEPLESRNTNKAYDLATTRELGRKLLGRDGTFWEFYPRESVEAMLEPAPVPTNAPEA